jgi:hypothetical protein
MMATGKWWPQLATIIVSVENQLTLVHQALWQLLDFSWLRVAEVEMLKDVGTTNPRKMFQGNTANLQLLEIENNMCIYIYKMIKYII